MIENTIDGFSNYFTFAELTYSAGHPELVSKNREDAKQFIKAGKRLSKLLESIRHILGDKPLKVSSGFRNPELNKAVGSKAKSSHTRFEAADIIPNMPIKEAFTAILNAHRAGLLQDLRKAIIEKNTWIHIECKMNQEEKTTFYTSSDGVNFSLVG